MIQNIITHPEIVERDKWLTARKTLLEHEKELTRQRDRVNAERRRLPMVKLEKEYSFERQEDFEDSPPGYPQKPTYG